jgi:hypothetical protein
MNPLDNFFTIDPRLDINIPGKNFIHYLEIDPEEYRDFFLQQLRQVFSVTTSMDWEYIYKVIGYVPGNIDATFEAYADKIAQHELLHYSAVPKDLEGLSWEFGFEVLFTENGYRINGRFKLFFDNSIPRDTRKKIDHAVAIAPYMVEGEILSVLDLKKININPFGDSSLQRFFLRFRRNSVPVES